MWNSHIEYILIAIMVFCVTSLSTMWTVHLGNVKGLNKKAFYGFMYGIMSIYLGTVVYQAIFFIP